MVIGGKHFGQYTYEHWFDNDSDTIDITLRLEEEPDYKMVENVTREAFWNVYKPGCDEHLVIHNLRKAKDFIRELDYVAVYDNKIVGNIVYAKAKILDGKTEHDVLIFGPISVLPKYQRMGIGKKLIQYTLEKSKAMGFNAVVIYGDPKYYGRFGFKNSRDYAITDMEGNYNEALQIVELYPQALENIKGRFFEGEAYQIDKGELEIFENGFPHKEKLVLDTQLFKE